MPANGRRDLIRRLKVKDIIQGNVITDLSSETKTYACKVRDLVRYVQVANLSRQTTWDRTDGNLKNFVITPVRFPTG